MLIGSGGTGCLKPTGVDGGTRFIRPDVIDGGTVLIDGGTIF